MPPVYKLVGNRILTGFENRMLGTELCEYHSGYRAYRIDALQPVPLERNSDDFDFDTHVLIQLQHAGKPSSRSPSRRSTGTRSAG